MSATLEVRDVNLFRDTQARGDEFARLFDNLRDLDPVHWSEATQCWVLTRHADVSAMMMNQFPLNKGGREGKFFAAIPREEWAERIPNLSRQFPAAIVNTDGAQHARLRNMLMKAFNRHIVEASRDYARTRAAELLDELVARGEFEFNEDFARAMAGYVLFRLMGLPEAVFPNLQEWATAITEALGAVGIGGIEKLERAEAATRSMNAVFLTELEKRKTDPRNDLITTLYQASQAEGENALSLDETLAQLQLIIIAGHDTTANTMTLSMEAFSRHPEALAYIREHPDEVGACVAEMQRYVSMSAGQTRVAGEDFELHGRQIKEGELVCGVIIAADRDPLKFDRPHELDLTRDNSEMMVFAPGPRSCIGHLLAKMQLAEFFTALAARVDRVEVLDPENRWMPAFVFRGLYELNVRVTPRAGD